MTDDRPRPDGVPATTGQHRTWAPSPDGPAQGPILGAGGEPTGPVPAIAPPPDIPAELHGRPTTSASHYTDDWRRRSDRPAGPLDGISWSTAIAVASVVVLLVAGVLVVARVRTADDGDTSAFGVSGGPETLPTVDDLAQATVQILGLDEDGEPVCAGSGTFVSIDGLILTNAHVVTADSVCDFASLGIAVTSDAGRPPDLLYRAEVAVLDAELDLAVLRVVAGFDPDAPVPAVFPALTLGDSDQLSIGDDLRILGYPEIGGDTITFTNGAVSGFTAQAGLGDRALIKTDATLAGGNSGGAAVDELGHLVGIPTKAGASEDGPAIDCRPVADTNGDGGIDEFDTCVPIGGFLNGIRPVNLAIELVNEARRGLAASDQGPRITVDPSTVAMSRPRFSAGEANNSPAQIIRTADAGITELCLFVDWAGIPDGIIWDGMWWRDGEVIEEYSLVGQRWEFGEAGSNFWMCAIDHQDGLQPGVYELGFFLDGQLIFAEGIALTPEPVEVIETTWENATPGDVCSLSINPDRSGQVGLNELSPGAIIPTGEEVTIELPVGTVVVEARDCAGNPVADSAGIQIEADQVYRIFDPDSPPPPDDDVDGEAGDAEDAAG